jgi:hypothetical protein
MMMNNQNITVFSVELGFTALPHLPDFPAHDAQLPPRIEMPYCQCDCAAGAAQSSGHVRYHCNRQ